MPTPPTSRYDVFGLHNSGGGAQNAEESCARLIEGLRDPWDSFYCGKDYLGLGSI
jgi:hypothetical protein